MPAKQPMLNIPCRYSDKYIAQYIGKHTKKNRKKRRGIILYETIDGQCYVVKMGSNTTHSKYHKSYITILKTGILADFSEFIRKLKL